MSKNYSSVNQEKCLEHFYPQYLQEFEPSQQSGDLPDASITGKQNFY